MMHHRVPAAADQAATPLSGMRPFAFGRFATPLNRLLLQLNRRSVAQIWKRGVAFANAIDTALSAARRQTGV